MSLDFDLKYKIDGNEINFFSKNITHNMGEMAKEAGIYGVLWHAENKKAKDIITTLEKGFNKLNKNPAYFEKFNPSNGWGNYESFMRFVIEVLEACKKYPNSYIEISR